MTALPADPTPESAARWTAVIPIKGGPAAKTRLADLPDDARQLLADAMALDVVGAALAADRVHEVIVVTSDPHISWAVRQLKATVVADGGAGLNPALQAAPVTGPRVYLLADLAALKPVDLDLTLALAEQHDTSFVVDAAGTGTSALFATSGVDIFFGPDSARLHADAGYTALAPVPVGITLDVDSLSDLIACAGLGCGPRTTHVINDLASTGILRT